MPAGVYHGLFPAETQHISVADAVKSIKRIFKSDIAPQDVAAIILEPVQGEGGFNVCPPEFMRAVRDHGATLLPIDSASVLAMPSNAITIARASMA